MGCWLCLLPDGVCGAGVAHGYFLGRCLVMPHQPRGCPCLSFSWIRVLGLGGRVLMGLGVFVEYG